MIINYDLHIHSALSPCAADNMTPVNICGFAKLKGLDMIAVADHNAIDNVQIAIKAGNQFGVTVIPAFELQTEEDIHILCYFETFEHLKTFHNSIEFSDLQNRADIFGNQLIIDENDQVIAHEKRLLLNAARIKVSEVFSSVQKYGGAALPAHIDREANSMLSILGTITEEFLSVEVSKAADYKFTEQYSKTHRVLISSDAHTLEDIGGGQLALSSYCAKEMIAYINGLN